MYEDRFDLRILQSQPITESSKGKTEKFGWLKNLGLSKSRPIVSPLCASVISSVRVPVKRTKELRGLVGWYVLILLCTTAIFTTRFMNIILHVNRTYTMLEVTLKKTFLVHFMKFFLINI